MKADIQQARETKAAEDRATRQRAANLEACAKMQREAAKVPFVRFLPDGVYANRPWVSKHLGPLPAQWDRDVGWVGVDMLGGAGGSLECVRVADLEDVFDSGRLGDAAMGRLEVFTIASFGDLAPSDRQLLGTHGPREVSDPVRQGLGDLFGPAKGALLGHAGQRRYWPQGEVPRWGQRYMWAAVNGDPSQGRHATLAGCLPVEIGYCHSEEMILWIRSLSHVPRLMKQTELGRARALAERVRQMVSDSPAGRTYLREVQAKVAALEQELAGGATETA